MVGGEAGNKGGERWADPVVSRAAELRLGRLFFRPAGLIWSRRGCFGDERGRVASQRIRNERAVIYAPRAPTLLCPFFCFLSHR